MRVEVWNLAAAKYLFVEIPTGSPTESQSRRKREVHSSLIP
jgi:hypothetical protein